MAKRTKYDDGGNIDPRKPITVDQWNQLKQKYTNGLPKVGGGTALDQRMEWAQWADQKLPTSGTPAELAAKAAKATGFKDPGLLLSSAMEEGIGNRFKGDKDKFSTAYTDAKIDQKAFPVDGFRNYGLDQIGGRVDEFIQKGYLPKDFKNNMKTFKAANETDEKAYYPKAFALAQKNGLIDKNLKYADKNDIYDKVDDALANYKGKDLPKMGQSAYTAAFKDDESAFMAKAAFLRAEQDNVGNYAKQKGYNLTPDEQSFFTTAAYNGGEGAGKAMLDYYGGKKELGNNGFLKDKMSSKGQVYDNVIPRYAGAKMFNGEGYFKEGGRMKLEQGDEIDPITGKPKPQQLAASGTVGQTIFPEDNGAGFPSIDHQPGHDMTVSEIGDPNTKQSQIVPLSQFYDKATDKYGNVVLNGTGKYTDAQGGFNTTANQQLMNNQISAQNLAHADAQKNSLNQIEFGASAGITAINAFFNKMDAAKQGRVNTRKTILDERAAPQINPYLEGTGSQAIMKKGGEIDGQNLGIQTLDGGKTHIISGSDHSNPMVEFKGREHKDGGIGIAYGGKIAEVEDKEVGFIDKEGGLNIFGKLKIPGTNTTFGKAAKGIAEQEDKINGQKSKYLNVLLNGNPANKYQESANSTAKVMFKSLDAQAKDIAEKKEAMADYQNLVLALTGKDNEEKKAYGGRMPKFAKGGKLDPNSVQSVQDVIDKYSNGKSPLKAEDFIEVANKYNVPLDLMLSQAINESRIGTAGRAVRTKNIFNVGNTDDGTENNQGSWKDGLENYAKLLKNEYADTNGNIDVEGLISSNFKRPKGGNYATDKHYGSKILNIMNELHGEGATTPQQASNDDPYPKTFKGFVSKDGKTYKAPEGVDPAAFYKNPDIVEALKKDQTFPKAAADGVWGIEHDKLWNSLPESTKQTILQQSKATATSGVTEGAASTSTGGGVDYTTNFTPKFIPITNTGEKAIDTPYGKANREAPAIQAGGLNLGNGETKRGFISPLAIEQIAPELLTVATNKREPVYQQTYQPELKQTFDMSYQLGRNENQSTFNQVAAIAEQTGNIDALGQFAAQKYKADEQSNMQEVQGNAAQKLQVYGQNVDTLNDARLKNLAAIDNQVTKQAQAKFNTRKEDLGAFTSVAGKVLQNNLENTTYNAYANLFKHYGFDKKGNVTFNPDDVVTKFTAGEAAQFGMLSAKKGADAIMSGDYSRQFTKVKNSDGSTTTSERLGTNAKIQEKYKALKAQGFDDGIIGNMLRAEFPETISKDQ